MRKPTLVDAYRARWRLPQWRDRTALVSEDAELTYRELADRVECVAGQLVDHGVKPGGIVALSMARTGNSVVVFLAILFAGGCACPLDSRLSAEEAAGRLGRIRCQWAVTDDSLRHQCERTGPRVRVIDCSSLRDDLRDVRPPHRVKPDSPALTLFTSGSTGEPKALQLTHRALENNAFGVVQHTGFSFADRVLHVMPIHHTNGINNQILAPLLAGSSVAFAPRFKAERMPGWMARYRPTIVTGVPTMYARMLNHSFPPEAKASLRMIRCGSAPITRDLHERIEATFECPVVISYGLSEATCTSTINPPDDRRIGSVGTVLPEQTVALLHPGRNERVPPGEEGEIAIAGASLMMGYLDDNGQPDPQEIASRWLRSGDMGRFDDDGYLFITGRIKDVIIRGGENIAPGVVEDALTADPDVESCCIVGQPDEDLGEVPVAFVVLRPGAVPDAARLIDLVGKRLSRIYQPAEIHFVDELPENAAGKVDRKALARRVAGAAETAG